MKKQLRIKHLAGALAVLLMTAPAYAQQTSSNIAGRVTDNEGAPLAGAEVMIVHTPSGTTSRAVTDGQGRYTARGLRVGGPYTVTVTRDGFKGEATENVFLALGETSALNVDLDTAATSLEAIQVVASAGLSVFNPDNMGTGTVLSSGDIAALPSAGRNIQDLIRLDPRISQTSKADGRISAAGQHSRYNLIRIDGVSTNDPFGLEANGLPTERQPVSVDAIEELNIALANYDVTYAGATGAVVNAVTRSGTNDFHGSVYYAYRDKDWVREDLQGVKFNGFNDETTYGGTFGGALVKDRLFFFANYEKYVRSAPGSSYASTPYGRGQITDADIAEAQRIARDVWGFDAGSLDPVKGDTEIEEYAVKFDWNINDDHRASLRYSKLEQNVIRQPGIGSSSISLSSYWYNQPKTFETWVGQLFSNWSDNFSTELKLSYRDYIAERAPISNLPSIRVNLGNQGLMFGTEVNTHVNVVDTTEKNVFFAGTYYLGDHALKFGIDYAENDIMNFYGRDLNGSYTFASLADFAAGTPSQYTVRTPRPGRDYGDIPATYVFENTGFFLQDNWSATYNLSLMFGIRVDIPDFDREPLYNETIHQMYGYDNRVTIDTKLWQPRFGFNYTFDTERSTQLRGGVGLFQGTAPNVWMAGAFQNTGLNFVAYDQRNPGAIFTPGVNPPYIPSGPGSTPRLRVDLMEPGLALPSVWKANLAFDHELPWHGIVASAELLMLNTKNDIYFESLDLGAPTFAGQDGRMIYWNAAGLNPINAQSNGIQNGRGNPGGGGSAGNRANRPSNIDQVMLARNTSKGESKALTLSLTKPMQAGDHWSWTAGYTYTDATQVSPMASSQNTSNWNGTTIYQVNENVSSTSRYAIRDRFTGVLTYTNAFFGDNNTTFGLFYEGRSGLPFSYIYYNDINGDGASTNDLFYVPAGRGDVLFTGGAQMENDFFNWLEQHPDLARYAGQVVPANSGRAKWVNNFDLRISQQLPSFFEGHKAEFNFDIMNVGNLLNKKWGLIEDYGFFQTMRVANYAGIDPATGKYVYTFSGSTDEPGIQENNNDKGNTGVSRWSVMATFKYSF
ncbi:MAG TPA: TonB-dependent receptor [Chiayiivirga sp.]|nr:TonB-dependent receptor [Chiayiivirga sp.]HRQ35784.1 TonB-dependent receptor [Chiayiivirga sp.]